MKNFTRSTVLMDDVNFPIIYLVKLQLLYPALPKWIFLALQQPNLFTDFILVPGPQTAGNEQDRLLSYWPQLAETTLPGFQEVLGRHITGSCNALTPMKRYSRRQYLQGLFATSILLALSQQSLSKAESSVPKAAKSSIWQLGIGADPTQLLGKLKRVQMFKN